jgi:Family of unknown function (DUF6069)
MLNRTLHRTATVVLAPIAALGTWAVIRLIGVDLVVSTGRGHVGAGDVVVAATLAALLAWIVVRQLERRVRRPRRTWSFVASACLAVSTIGPDRLADGSSAVALIVLHFVTAAVVIAGFAGTLPWRRPEPTGLPSGHGTDAERAGRRTPAGSVGVGGRVHQR